MKNFMKKYFGVIGFVLLAAVLVACGGPAGTTPPETYTVSGIVTESEDPVRAVLIRAESEAGGDVETTSANDGSWTLTGLQGEVTITAEDPAYTTDGSITLSGAASGLTFVLNLNQCNAGRVDDQDDPCVITRIQQVRDIDKYLDGFFKLGADIDARETVDWNDGEGFKPIGDRFPGDVVEPFIGTLDGDGYAIEGLVIDRPNEDYVGLFAVVSDNWDENEINNPHHPDYQSANIKDIVLRDFEITGSKNVGALAGEVDNDASITEVHIENGVVVGLKKVGGLIGGAANQLIERTSSTAEVYGETRVGGLIGDWDGITLTKSFAAGIVAGDKEVGGLIGFAEDDVSESFSTGVVVGRLEVGGLIGMSDGEISNSYSLAKVTGVGDDPEDIGGFIGNNSDDVEFSFSAGKVTAEGATNVYGFANGAANDSYWDIDVAGVPAAPGVGVPKSTEEMQAKDTYAGWDFDNIWKINEGEDYPDLINNPRQ